MTSEEHFSLNEQWFLKSSEVGEGSPVLAKVKWGKWTMVVTYHGSRNLTFFSGY